jgi:hypothetical protein
VEVNKVRRNGADGRGAELLAALPNRKRSAHRRVMRVFIACAVQDRGRVKCYSRGALGASDSVFAHLGRVVDAASRSPYNFQGPRKLPHEDDVASSLSRERNSTLIFCQFYLCCRLIHVLVSNKRQPLSALESLEACRRTCLGH